jgi:hypothetical protein
MQELLHSEREKRQLPEDTSAGIDEMDDIDDQPAGVSCSNDSLLIGASDELWRQLRHELHEIRALLSPVL